MAFHSETSKYIWEKLYTVMIPDYLTIDSEYIRKFGVRITEDKKINSMITTNLITVMVPLITILRYYSDGIEIRIPDRVDMISMHKDIELYLNEWRDHIKYDINLDVNKHKELLLSLERLSKYIYDKSKPVEVIDNLSLKSTFGLINNFERVQETNIVHNKPDYSGISKLIKATRTRY